VKPLAEWALDARLLVEAEFCNVHRYPFLLFSMQSTHLRPVSETRGLTMDRLQVGSGPKPISGSMLEDYVAAEVVSLRPTPTIEITLGCSSMCDVQINDSSVSNLHAYFWLDHGRWFVRDAASLTGTKVNDGDPSEPLLSGDRISIGLVDLIFLDASALYQLVRRLDTGAPKQTPRPK
jgi:hypothetical protein